MEVVALAEHPRVVRQPEVLCYHEQDAANDGILNGQSKCKSLSLLNRDEISLKRSHIFQDCVLSAVDVWKHDVRLENNGGNAMDEQGGEEILVDSDARHAEDPKDAFDRYALY